MEFGKKSPQTSSQHKSINKQQTKSQTTSNLKQAHICCFLIKKHVRSALQHLIHCHFPYFHIWRIIPPKISPKKFLLPPPPQKPFSLLCILMSFPIRDKMPTVCIARMHHHRHQLVNMTEIGLCQWTSPPWRRYAAGEGAATLTGARVQRICEFSLVLYPEECVRGQRESHRELDVILAFRHGARVPRVPWNMYAETRGQLM